MFLKFWIIKKVSKSFFVSAIAYFFTYYILLDLTQIRVSAALAFVFVSVYLLVIVENKITAFLFLFIAVSFHYTAIIFTIVFFLNNRNIRYVFYIVLPFAGLFLSLYSYYIFEYVISFLPPIFHVRYTDYIHRNTGGVNIFSLYVFAILLLYYSSIIIVKFKCVNDKVFILSTKMIGFGIFFFYFFSFLPVISYRVSEMFFIFQIFTFPWFLVVFNKYKKYAISILSIYLIGYFYFYGLVLLNFKGA